MQTWVNVLLVIVTAILAITGIWQVVIQRQTAKRQLRAYIGANENIDENGRDLKFDADKTVRAVLCVRNVGQTPAYAVRFTSRVEELTHPLPKTFAIPDIEHAKQGSVVQPNEVLYIEAHSPKGYSISKRAFLNSKQDARKNPTRWFVYGRVEYADIYGEGHWTEFCYWMSWHGEKGAKSPPGWYLYKGGYNSTDRGCECWFVTLLTTVYRKACGTSPATDGRAKAETPEPGGKR